MKRMSKRVKEAKKLIPNYSKLLKYTDYGDFVELIVNRWGDVCVFRVYNNGDVTEK